MGNKKKDKTYYTYGGVETEDTLSSEEIRELDQKRENNTLTDEDRDKLFNDDSISSTRSTTGLFEKDRVKYNPNVQYFMLDYFDKNEVRHVRNPYMTQFELLPHIRDYIKNWTNYSEFRIHSEKELDIKLKVECKDGEYRELTLRQILFGNRYEDFSDSCKDPQSDFFKIMYDTRNLSEEDEEEMEQIHETPSSTLSYIKSNDKNSIHPIN
jgi:hypothetical protein